MTPLSGGIVSLKGMAQMRIKQRKKQPKARDISFLAVALNKLKDMESHRDRYCMLLSRLGDMATGAKDDHLDGKRRRRQCGRTDGAAAHVRLLRVSLLAGRRRAWLESHHGRRDAGRTLGG